MGILIPPSVTLIVYGVLTQTSVPELYLAGVFPGIMLAALFSLMILFICILKPEMGGDRISATWRERFLALIDLIPPAILFLGVIGTIYAGLATPTEAASIGVVLSLDSRRMEAKADGNDAAGVL